MAKLVWNGRKRENVVESRILRLQTIYLSTTTLGLMMRTPFSVLGFLVSFASLVFIATNYARAAAGDLDNSFDGDGILRLDVEGGADQGNKCAIYQSGPHAGKIVQAGRTDAAVDEAFGVVRLNANGSLDTSFSADGKAFANFGSTQASAEAVAVDSLDRVIVVGWTWFGSGWNRVGVARFTASGLLDTTFNGTGMVLYAEADVNYAYDVRVQSDDKIVVLCQHGQSGNNRTVVRRLNVDGSTDWSRNIDVEAGSGFEGPDSLAIDPSGRILAGGWRQSSGAGAWIARITTAGALDASFGSGGTLLMDVGGNSEGVLGFGFVGGQIYIGGTAESFSSGRVYSGRLNDNGTFDNTYGPNNNGLSNLVDSSGTGDTNGVYAAVDSTGRVMVVAYANGPTSFSFTCTRFTAGGDVDTTFAGDGHQQIDMGFDDRAEGCAIQPDGKLVITGWTGSSTARQFGLCRLETGSGVTVSSINRLSPAGATNLTDTSVTWRVTLSAGVTGVNSGNFSINASGITGAAVISVSGSGTTWDVTASTGSGDGTLRLDMVNSTGVTPTVGALPFNTGQTYGFNRTPNNFVINSGGSQSATVGNAFSTAMSVTIRNSANVAIPGVTVTFSPPGSGATCSLSGGTTGTSNGSGVVSKTATANTISGTYSVGVSAGSASSSITSVTNSADVLNNFLVENVGGGAIPGQIAGSPFNIRLTARDQYNNTAASFVSTATITSNGTLSAGGTTTNFTAGVLATHSVTITSSQSTTTLTATNGASNGTSNQFSVAPGATTAFEVSGIPSPAAAGVGHSLTVRARDGFGNTTPGYLGQVAVTSSDTAATLPPLYTFNAGDAGIHVFSGGVTFGTLGTQSVTVTDTSVGAITGAQVGINVVPGPVSDFLVEAAGGGSIGSQVAGTAFNIQLTARDSLGNTATSFTGTVNLTSTSTIGSGGGPTAAFTAGVLSSHAIALNSGGSHSVTATNSAGPETGTSNLFTIDPRFDFTVTIAENADPVVPGSGAGNLVHTVTITNNGPSDATGVTVNVTQSLPTGTTLDSATPSGSTTFIAPTWTVGSLASGASETLTLTMTVGATTASGTSASTTATLTAPSGAQVINPGDDSDTEATSVAAESDLAVTKTNAGASLTPGVDNVDYTITITNNGPSAITTASLTDTFPAGVTGITWTASVTAGTASGFTASGSGNIVETGLSISVGGTITYVVNATVSAAVTGTTLSNTATSAPGSGASDPTPGNDSATANNTLTPSSDVGLSVTDSADPIVLSGTLTYSFTVSNTGPSDAANTSVVNTIPAGCTFSAATPSAGTYASGTGVWDVGTLASGATATLTLDVVVPATPQTINNSASVSSNSADPNLSNNSVNEDTLVDDLRDLRVERPVGTVIANGGNDNLTGLTPNVTAVVTYRLSNAGTVGITLTATPTVTGASGGTAILSVTPATTIAAGSFTALDVMVTPTGGAYGFTLTVSSDDADKTTYTINVSGTTADAGSARITRGAQTMAPGGSDTVGVAAQVGQPVIVTYTLDNAGPGTLGSLVLSTANESNATISSSLTVTSVATGANTTFTVTATPTAVGQWSVDVSLASDDPYQAPFTFTLNGAASTSGGPALSIERNGLAVAPSSTDDIGDATITPTTTTVTYTLRNVGTSALTIANATLGTPTNATAAISTSPVGTIAAGATATLAIDVTPATAAAFDVLVTIDSDSATGASTTFTLAGTGVAGLSKAMLLKRLGDTSVLTFAHASTDDLGSVEAGTEIVMTYTIANTGSDTLNLTAPAAVLTNLTNVIAHVMSQPASLSIAAGGSTTVTISLTPVTTGAISADLQIANDTVNNPHVVTISSAGQQPEIGVRRPQFNLLPSGSTDTVGNLTVNSTTTLTYTILNRGAATLTITAITATGATNATATVTLPASMTIAPGATETFTVDVTATADNSAFTFTLTITSDGVNEPTYTLTVAGNGVVSQITTDCGCNGGIGETGPLALLAMIGLFAGLIAYRRRFGPVIVG